MAEDELRHHNHRLRSGRLRYRDSRGAAWLQDCDRREQISGRHLPQLGLHPTKALLRSAEIFHYMQRAKEFGLSAGRSTTNGRHRQALARHIERLNDGVGFLMKKNKIR